MADPAALSNRLHLFARPSHRDAMRVFFTEVLDCTYDEVDGGLEHPVAIVRAARGAFSIEYRDDAYAADETWRGAWIEFAVDDREAMQQRLREAGVPEFRHPGSAQLYYRMPNGQVFRVIPNAVLR